MQGPQHNLLLFPIGHIRQWLLLSIAAGVINLVLTLLASRTLVYCGRYLDAEQILYIITTYDVGSTYILVVIDLCSVHHHIRQRYYRRLILLSVSECSRTGKLGKSKTFG